MSSDEIAGARDKMELRQSKIFFKGSRISRRAEGVEVGDKGYSGSVSGRGEYQSLLVEMNERTVAAISIAVPVAVRILW